MIDVSVPLIQGLIPAHAGKTSARVAGMGPNRAHPRSRGENKKPMELAETGLGSSPLTRGKQSQRREGPAQGGLIPAHAGKTPVLVVREIEAWAHPRSRGENTGPHGQRSTPAGSSPLTRGKR